MKAIIYYRKSTDRDDMQANSLEHQLGNCRKTVESYELDVLKEIGESRSAKTEFTRTGFNEMIAMCKKKKIDYIIADEPKRLSRNNIDTSRIVDLMDKKCIKGVLCTNRVYSSDNSRDKFLLQLDLSLSKMDNEDRAKDVKDKMYTCLSKGKWVGHAPDGYRNITIRKGHKDIELVEERAKWIKRIFYLRCEGYSISRIAEILESEGYRSQNGNIVPHEQIKRKIQNKFYMGVMEWGGQQHKGNHTPIISEKIFYKANNIKPKQQYIKKDFKYNFSCILKTMDNVAMKGYTKKGHIYYIKGAKSSITVNISEKKVIEKAFENFKGLEFPKPLKKITLAMFDAIFEKREQAEKKENESVEERIKALESKKSFLLENLLDGTIGKDIYKMKNSEIEKEIEVLKSEKVDSSQKNSEKYEKLKKRVELLFSLYKSQEQMTDSQKVEFIKSFGVELFLTHEKELQIGKNSFFETLKKLIFSFGTATGNRTPVLGMRIPCPNH